MKEDNAWRRNWMGPRGAAPVRESDLPRERAEKAAGGPLRLRRIRLVVIGILTWAGCLGGRLVHLQFLRHTRYAEIAEGQQERTLKVQPPRGTISDRNGRILATSVPAVSLGVDREFIEDEKPVAELLGQALGVSPAEIRRKIDFGAKNNFRFVWIKRPLDASEVAYLEKRRQPWMAFRADSRRVYPGGRLGAPVVGAVNVNGDGAAGLEVSQNSKLAGKAGHIRVLRDGHRRGIGTLDIIEPAEAGRDVQLTLDAELQYHADAELAKQVKKHDATSGTAIIADPHTGEVLALAAYPGFDPSERPRTQEDLRRRNHPAVIEAHDPGSVMKLVTLAAALESTRLRAQSWIPCGNGLFRFGKEVIHDHHSYSALTMEQVIWKSSNIGAIHMGIAVGRDRMKQYLRAFGFGRRTGIEIPGEQPGMLNERWRPSTLYYVSFGHELTATTVQLAQATSVFANGGYLVHPRLIRSIQGTKQPQPEKVRVIRAETAAEVRRISEGVILHGTARDAAIRGYTAGGKTGTAQMLDPKTGKYTHRYASTFLGYAPLSRPRIVVVVTLYGTAQLAGPAVAPLFSRLAGAALHRLGVDPDIPLAPGEPSPDRTETGPKLMAEASPAAQPEAAKPDLRPVTAVGPRIPDFQGMPKNEVLRESAALGMPVEIVGNGLARRQEPAPGAILAPGKSIRVYFVR
jgi:cell division protein FtsI (penicillin-binding protein 3)